MLPWHKAGDEVGLLSLLIRFGCLDHRKNEVSIPFIDLFFQFEPYLGVGLTLSHDCFWHSICPG